MFKKDMLWGASTAAYQIEGAAFEDGKGLSVWDVFCERPKVIKNGDNGNVVCDHYHKYKEDIKLLSEMGVNSYRFSVSWPRILPNGTGRVNPKGIEFYNNIINELLKYGIQPCMTLFHWDYPYELDKCGGWINDKSPEWFEEYTEVIAREFGDRVKMFITFNEPQVFMGQGYLTGKHAPGKQFSARELVTATYNVLVAHQLSVKKLREIVPDCKVGYSNATTPAIPFSSDEKDIQAARNELFKFDKNYWIWHVAWWCDPIYTGKFPDNAKLAGLEKYLPQNFRENYMDIFQPVDFCGLNIYNGNYYKMDEFGNTCLVSHKSGSMKTALDWPVTPSAMYWGPKFIYERYGVPIVITENGIACNDERSTDGAIHDRNRIDFMQRYISQLEKAAESGIDISGYFTWSFIDNFEWTEGCQYRFGLVYVDYETGERIPKESFSAYKEIINSYTKGK